MHCRQFAKILKGKHFTRVEFNEHSVNERLTNSLGLGWDLEPKKPLKPLDDVTQFHVYGRHTKNYNIMILL